MLSRSYFGLRRLSSACNNSINLKGVFIPLATNFDEDQKINYGKIKKNLEFYETIPLGGYVVAGSNGEVPYLTHQERIDLVKFVKENTKRVVIGGSTAESTITSRELTEAMKNAGADGVLVMPPFYFRRRMTEQALISHYHTVADVGLPLIIYNMPVVSGIDVPTSTLKKLSQHPNIRAVKDSDIRKCAATVLETKGNNFDVLIGSAGYLLSALMMGCSGGINGLAGALTKQCSDVYQLYVKNQFQDAQKLQISLCKPDILLLAELGVPGLKYAMELLGLQGGLCRKPIQPISESDKKLIQTTLQEAGFL